MVAGPSNVVKGKAVVDGIPVCDLINSWKAFAVIEASKLYHCFYVKRYLLDYIRKRTSTLKLHITFEPR